MRATTNGISAVESAVLDLVGLDEIVDLARSLIAVPGVNPPGDELARSAVLARACVERGLDVELADAAPDRPNVHARLVGGEQPGLLLLGHSDVVPLGEGWTPGLAPGSVRNGRLVGRGSADMLGGLAAAVVAMAAVRRSGRRLGGPIELATVVDEEERGLGIRHFLSTARAAEQWAGCVVAEPTDLQAIIAARGAMYVRIRVHGKAAHSGRPGDGVSAIYGAAEVISEIERWNTVLAREPHPLSELVGPATWSVGTVGGGSGTSVVPAECQVAADRRLLPGEKAEEVLARVRDRLEHILRPRGLGFEIDSPMDMPGFATPADHPLVQTSDQALGDAGGPRLALGGWTAACDGGFVARDTGTPVIVLGPGSVTTAAHRPDESVPVADLLVAARTYVLIMLRMLDSA